MGKVGYGIGNLDIEKARNKFGCKCRLKSGGVIHLHKNRKGVINIGILAHTSGNCVVKNGKLVFILSKEKGI